ncbi:hypothetical protein N431DRAFT_545797 [Stipitochalara longipes BDJ]|nr:hypothetical protein N431DRAFT_545797 [Stipitochalara longipes BDJ]
MDDSNQQRPSPPRSYHFVTEAKPGQASQIRRHVAKERWRQRKAPGLARFQRTKPRSLASAPTFPASTSSPSDSETASTLSNNNNAREVFIDLRHFLQKGPTKWTITSIPSSSAPSPSPYQSLGYAELDPFNGIQISREDQNLLHHWTNVYAFKAFGQPDDPTFLPLSNVYVPIDLSNEASIHATLAHAAMHMAYLLGKPSSIPALHHKSAAIRLINESLNDPEIAVSDGTLAAVLRMLTFESFWGTEDAMRLHQKGLSQLVKQRGGLDTLRGNWRLEMRILLAPLVSKRHLAPPDIAPHSKFINVFSEIAIPGPEISIQYPAIGRVMEYLRSLAKNSPLESSNQPLPQQEIERLMCIVYISFACTRSQYTRFNLELLNEFLERTEEVWFCSVSILRPDAEIARLLTLSSYSSLEKRYLDILVQEPTEEVGGLLSPEE